MSPCSSASVSFITVPFPGAATAGAAAAPLAASSEQKCIFANGHSHTEWEKGEMVYAVGLSYSIKVKKQEMQSSWSYSSLLCTLLGKPVTQCISADTVVNVYSNFNTLTKQITNKYLTTLRCYSQARTQKMRCKSILCALISSVIFLPWLFRSLCFPVVFIFLSHNFLISNIP